MGKVVGIDGKEMKQQNETSVKGLLETLAEEKAHKYDGCVLVLSDSKGNTTTEIAWVGLKPLEVVGALAVSQSMILDKNSGAIK